jgi:hypothetical protein
MTNILCGKSLVEQNYLLEDAAMAIQPAQLAVKTRHWELHLRAHKVDQLLY